MIFDQEREKNMVQVHLQAVAIEIQFSCTPGMCSTDLIASYRENSGPSNMA